jgi:nucleotide-binding universal stress UspA family protein
MSYASHPERTQQPLGAASRFTSIAGDTTETIAKQDRPQSVVVGIDGTQAALDAAAWAVAEAASLGLPLRLVHVSVARTPAGHSDSVADDARHAESMLYLAEMVVHDMATPVNIETTIVQGSPDYVLIDESRSAALVCVGAAGKGPCARMPLGSTAAALAKHAHRRGGYAERQFC